MADRLPPENEPFTLEIKARHFERARVSDSSRCLIARALEDTFPDLEAIHVETNRAKLGGTRWRHDGRRIVDDFDAGLLYPETFVPGTRVRFDPIPAPPFPGR